MSLTLKARDTQLRVVPYPIPASAIGPENPFPPMHKVPRKRVDPDDQAHIKKHHGLRVGYGAGGTLLPYNMQDGYSRSLKRQNFRAIVLENRHLRATFLPELGGRLWSLIHKKSRRELLDVNPVIQLGNLAYRDAWFSGGVEWNVCVPAYHTPLTCSPMFTGFLRLDDGTPVLRLWEWERRLGVAYQIDAWLPADATFLRVRFRIHNPHDHVLPLYQWSNIAVPETPDTRVIAPASTAFINQYDQQGLRTTLEPIPVFQKIDISYPIRGMCSRDYFFNLRQGRPWITALRADGLGLIQTSTARQTGRKLFIWGQSTGGLRWQEYLSVPKHAYIEIQAGLARTQLEAMPMPAGATWDWLEAYGLMSADPAVTHGPDWHAAHTHVDRRLDAALPAKTLDAELHATDAMASRRPESIVMRGSGWGALERKRCEASVLPLPRGVGALVTSARKNKKPSPPLPWAPGILFDDASLTRDQAPWLKLLKLGALPKRTPRSLPGTFHSSPPWRTLLEASLKKSAGNHWLAMFHLGVMRYDADETDRAARAAWEKSMSLQPNPWSARCLARLALREKDFVSANAWYRRARRFLPHDPRLAAEACDVLRILRQPKQIIKIIAKLPPTARHADRVQLARAWAALDTGDYQTALDIILSREFACIREGELSLASIWFRAQELRLAHEGKIPLNRALRLRARTECPPPHTIDMRMKPGTPEEEVSEEERFEAKLARLRRHL